MTKEEEALAMLKALNESVGKVSAQVGEIDGKILSVEQRLVVVEGANKSRIVSIPGINDGKNKGKFSFQRMIVAIATKNWDHAPFEKEVSDQVRKALGTDTGPAGGYIVPTEYVAEVIELLRAKTVVRELGATILDGLTGSPVEIPKQTGGATGYWVGQNSAITASDPTLGQLSLTPKQASAMTKLSNRLLKLSNPSAEALVRNDIALTLARLIDLAALRGSGTANQPMGIANTPSINTLALGTNGASPTIDNLYDMLYSIELANADDGKLGFGVHPRTWNALRKLKDTYGQYYLQPDPTAPGKFTIAGFPVRKTTQIPINLVKGGSGAVCSEIYFGNWADLIIAEWGGLEILASMETGEAFEKNQTWVRIIQEVDIALRHPESFCLCSDALA